MKHALLILVALFGTFQFRNSLLLADPPGDRAGNAGASTAAANAGPASFDDVLTELALANMPEQYVDDRRWGGQKRVFDGIKWSGKGLKLKATRRQKEVNHGTWRRYEVSQIDPARHFSVRMENLRQTEGGKIAFDLLASARLLAHARLSQWNRGLQLASLSTDAEADVELRLSFLAEITPNFERLPPDLAIELVATDGELRMRDFRVRRISKLDGPVVRELGDVLRGTLARKVEEKSDRIVERVNRQLAKKQDELRFSPAELAASGLGSVTQLLPGQQGAEDGK